MIRVTIDTVRSGQPRAYADSVSETYVLLETTPWNKPGAENLEPWDVTTRGGKPLGPENVPEVLKSYVPGLRVGPKSAQKYGLEPYLAAFGPAPSRGPGWYRYVVISPFTD